MSCVWMLQRGHSGDGCVLASTLCKYDLKKGDLFVLSWARVRLVNRGSLSSELLMCGGGVRSILSYPIKTVITKSVKQFKTLVKFHYLSLYSNICNIKNVIFVSIKIMRI